MVPGSDTSLATFDSRGTASPQGSALALAAQARRLDPGNHLAVIAWLGYPAPSTLSPAVLTSGDAGQGASALRPLVDDLARRGHQVALHLPQLRLGAVRPGRGAPARHRHRGDRESRDGRLVRGGAAHRRPGVGGPGNR